MKVPIFNLTKKIGQREYSVHSVCSVFRDTNTIPMAELMTVDCLTKSEI